MIPLHDSALATRGRALLADGRPMRFDVPDEDRKEWTGDISAEERARLREVWACFRQMAAARTLKAGALAAANARHHLGWGWSAKSLLNLFHVYRCGGHKPGDLRKTGPIYPAGDWRVLLRNHAGATVGSLPAEFVRWLGEQWAQFRGRTDCMRATWRHVVHEVWLKGAPVPGYGTVDEWCRRTGRARPHPLLVRASELPEGWSERTFRRHLPRRESVRQQVAHGYLAAHSAQPDQVLTDRAPLMPLQYVFLDDSRPDVRCTWFGPGGKGEIVYPLLVLGLDAASGVDLFDCAKPRGLRSPEAEDALERKARHGVTQDMALLVVLNVLRRFGLPPWPITFVHENAAACVPPEAKHALHAIYGDRIAFEATGIFREKMMAHGFGEQGGAPYDKAPIEAFWRILMTQTARLPGATGPRYDTAPGDLRAIEKYTLGLIDRAGGVAEVFRKFSSPLLDFPEAHAALQAALRLLRFRTAHKLQGFDRVREWRRSPAEGYRPWAEFLALPVAEQDAIATNGDRDAILARLECPAERFCRLLHGVEMEPVEDDLLVWIQGPRERVRVRDGKITVSRAALGDDAMIFRETDHPLLDADYEGKEFEAAIAGDGQRIVLTEEGRILGSVARQERISRADTAAIHREQGRVRAARVADRELLSGYFLADTNDALATLRAQNAAVAATLPAALPRGQTATPAAVKRVAATRQGRRAKVDREIAEASRATAAATTAPTGGGLYDE